MKYRHKLVSIVIALVISVSVTEVGLRMLRLVPHEGYPDGMYQKDELLGYSLTPNFEGKLIKHEFATKFRTNSIGMNDVEYGQKNEDDYRVLALGASFAWGAYGAGLNETFLKKLEQKLNTEHNNTNYQVMNAGVPGYALDRQLLWLKNRGLAFKPDMLLVTVYAGNVFHEAAIKRAVTVDERGQLVSQKHIIKGGFAFFVKIRDFFIKHSHFYRMAENKCANLLSRFVEREFLGKMQNWDKGKNNVFMIRSSDMVTGEINTALDMLGEINDIAKENKLPIFVVIIPSKYQVDDYFKELFIKDNGMFAGTYDMEKPQKILAKWGKENGVEIIDPIREFRDKNQGGGLYWRINPHLNKRGNEILSGTIFGSI